MAMHTLSPRRETLHGTFSPSWKPALRIDPGDTVVVETLDARWSIEDPAPDGTPGRRFAPRDPERDNGHALCGPIAIDGAEPGMVLVVQIEEIIPAAWGWTVAGGWPNGINERLGVAATELRMTWTLDHDAGTAINQFGHVVRMRPFMGVMGMPGIDPTPVPSWTPRPQGGNIDCKELVAGSTLFLPIAVAGALFSVGDGHAAQGDGEVCSTAIECPMASCRLTLSLRDDITLTTPIARTPDAWIAMGFDEDLDEATLIATDAMLDILGREHGLNRHEGLALASVAMDLRVTQIVNGHRGVHAIFRDDAVGGLPGRLAAPV